MESLGDAGKTGDAPLIVKTIAATSAQIQPTALFEPCQVPFYNKIGNATEIDGWITFGQVMSSTSLKSLYIYTRKLSSNSIKLYTSGH